MTVADAVGPDSCRFGGPAVSLTVTREPVLPHDALSNGDSRGPSLPSDVTKVTIGVGVAIGTTDKSGSVARPGSDHRGPRFERS